QEAAILRPSAERAAVRAARHHGALEMASAAADEGLPASHRPDRRRLPAPFHLQRGILFLLPAARGRARPSRARPHAHPRRDRAREVRVGRGPAQRGVCRRGARLLRRVRQMGRAARCQGLAGRRAYRRADREAAQGLSGSAHPHPRAAFREARQMTVTYAHEKLAAAIDEIKQTLPAMWAEMAEGFGDAQPEPNWSIYFA